MIFLVFPLWLLSMVIVGLALMISSVAVGLNAIDDVTIGKFSRWLMGGDPVLRMTLECAVYPPREHKVHRPNAADFRPPSTAEVKEVIESCQE
ncbi:hypothetical protein [Acetonema longum]|uniref:Uncharacterized protein n=1 Tax=Acetonema longum DSM 6540 TaxID=1009370 RepID=F7NKE7_9FIRM|nr:hypothetical protein [Acetonema longum]EGO63588.1 hypothetical protein ALO_12801 [Acetonema longum DSM 6540]